MPQQTHRKTLVANDPIHGNIPFYIEVTVLKSSTASMISEKFFTTINYFVKKASYF